MPCLFIAYWGTVSGQYKLISKLFLYICLSMRLIVFILTVYIMGLSFAPCSDANNRCVQTTMETELNQPHSHSDDDGDACSIFCYCNCCSGNITAFEYQIPRIDGIPISIYFDNRLPVLNTTLVSNYFGSIWQPPKVSA